MTEYRVVWETELDAESPQEAAESALADVRNPAAGATCFSVTEMMRASEKFAGWDVACDGPDRLVAGSTVLIDLNPELS